MIAGRIRRLLAMAGRRASQQGIPDTGSSLTMDMLPQRTFGDWFCYASRLLAKRASSGTSTFASGLPQPVTGSHPGPAW